MKTQFRTYTIHLLKHKKQDIFVILLALVLVNIILTIVALIFLQNKNASPSRNAPITAFPSSPSELENNYTLKYNTEAHSKLADILINRPAISQQDNDAKANMLQTTVKGFNSGIVYETSNVRVEYVESVDMFMAEILTPNIQAAKDETNIWFREKGISQKGICKLPIMFYVNKAVIEELKTQNTEFNPLPNGCL